MLCVAVEKDAASTARCMKVKLLQFRENYRPAYYGTWRKRSRKVTARRPLAQDSVSTSGLVTSAARGGRFHNGLGRSVGL